MPLYHDAEMQIFFPEVRAAETWPCQVNITGSSISISYRHNDGYAVYKGSETEPGHYRLLCENPKGRATLHRFADDETLEGWWVEERAEGMWRIELHDNGSGQTSKSAVSK